MRTEVVIVGAGPAGLLLQRLLRLHGVESVILEQRSRQYVEGRIRAGVLERGTVSLLEEVGVSERMAREGLVHDGFEIAVDGETFRIDLKALTGSSVTVFGQTELTKDLIAASVTEGLPIIFEARDVAIHDVETSAPYATYRQGGADHRIDCLYIAGCDGQHGVCRKAITAAEHVIHERVYPFGWLGILADVPPCAPELIYASHADGFALASMRSPGRSRYYIQAPLDTELEAWPAERIWDELDVRLGPAGAGITRGLPLEISLAPLRSVLIETMRKGRLFLAGDAAHLVPPTGAKGLNLAASDVRYLAEGLVAACKHNEDSGLDAYAARALARVAKAVRFSWWFTGLTHRFPDADGFSVRMQRAELDYIRSSPAAQTTLAENYVGLPF